MRRAAVIAAMAVACGGGSSAPSKQPPPAPGPHDKVPPGYVEMRADDVLSVSEAQAVVLVDDQRTVILPIFIGGTEALSIALRMRKQPFVRPLTHDLLDAVIRRLGGTLVRVQVDALVDTTFVGSIYLHTSAGIVKLDARPSDAVALAIGNQVPIYVAKDVLDRAGLDPKQLEPETTAGPAGAGDPPPSL